MISPINLIRDSIMPHYKQFACIKEGSVGFREVNERFKSIWCERFKLCITESQSTDYEKPGEDINDLYRGENLMPGKE